MSNWKGCDANCERMRLCFGFECRLGFGRGARKPAPRLWRFLGLRRERRRLVLGRHRFAFGLGREPAFRRRRRQLRGQGLLGFRCDGEDGGVILGSGGPGLLYLGKRVCRPPGRRSGAREGYMGRSGSLGSSMGSIWATACPRTWPFGGVHVQSGVRKGRGPKDIYSTE